MIYSNAKHALAEAALAMPCGIAYIQGKGWKIYDLTLGCKEGEPEFACLAPALCLPLTETAIEVMESLQR